MMELELHFPENEKFRGSSFAYNRVEVWCDRTEIREFIMALCLVYTVQQYVNRPIQYNAYHTHTVLYEMN